MVQFRAKIGETEYPLEGNADCRVGEAKMQLEQVSGVPASQQKWIYQVTYCAVVVDGPLTLQCIAARAAFWEMTSLWQQRGCRTDTPCMSSR